MKVIATRQNPDGTYDEVGMNNCRLFSQYQTINGALRYAVRNWTGPVRFEFFAEQGFLNPTTQPFKTIIRGE